MEAFRILFDALPDPRAQNARHDLTEILLISFAATLCGAETCVDIAQFAEAKEPTLRRFLELRHGPPSHDTVSRVFRLLDPDAFEEAFRRFMAAFAARLQGFEGSVVAIDGKSLSAACKAGARPRRCIWSRPGRHKAGWCWGSAARKAAARRMPRWSWWRCSILREPW
jgi:hypothetical protein